MVYVTGLGRCPAILEVTAEPTWDPMRVDEEANPGEGDVWGVVTEVEGLHSIALDKAPNLESIGVATASIQRKGHTALEQWQYAEAERLIRGRRAPIDRAGGSTALDVPIEEGEVEGYEVVSSPDARQAIRRESRLVGDYRAFLEAVGDDVSRKKLVLLPRRIRSTATCSTRREGIWLRPRQARAEATSAWPLGNLRITLGSFRPGLGGRFS